MDLQGASEQFDIYILQFYRGEISKKDLEIKRIEFYNSLEKNKAAM